MENNKASKTHLKSNNSTWSLIEPWWVCTKPGVQIVQSVQISQSKAEIVGGPNPSNFGKTGIVSPNKWFEDNIISSNTECTEYKGKMMHLSLLKNWLRCGWVLKIGIFVVQPTGYNQFYSTFAIWAQNQRQKEECRNLLNVENNEILDRLCQNLLDKGISKDARWHHHNQFADVWVIFYTNRGHCYR